MSRPLVLTRPRERAPYQPFGAALAAWKSRRREILLSGPAGTGKSRGLLEKMHYCCDKYKGIRALMCRKTRHSITQTTMVTYEKKVLPDGWLDNYIKWNTTDQQYEYPNGSIIAVAGLDKPSKIMSSEYDIIYVPEATELTEEDWEMLGTRLRNGKMPYHQLMADCNPGPPTHWLKARCDRGDTLMLYSKHEDNPSITSEYLAALDRLTGVRKKRLRDGLWAASEGMVYADEWNPDFHIIDRFDIPLAWQRYWTIDFGFRNPFVWQTWAENHDNELFMYKEIYQTELLVEDAAKMILDVTKDDRKPTYIICDHDLEDRMTLEKHTYLRTIPAKKDVAMGIQAMQSRLRKAKNGRAGMYFLRDSLIKVDQKLVEKKFPYCTTQEFENYIWDIEAKTEKEEPVKKYDHGMDAARYLMMFKSGISADDYIAAMRARMEKQK